MCQTNKSITVEKLTELIEKRKRMKDLHEKIGKALDRYDNLFAKLDIILKASISLEDLELDDSIFESAKEFFNENDELSATTTQIQTQSDQPHQKMITQVNTLNLFGLQLTDAVFLYLSEIFPKAETMKEIENGLLENGYKPTMSHFYGSILSILKYHSKKGVFEKNSKSKWKMTRNFRLQQIEKNTNNLNDNGNSIQNPLNFQQKGKSIYDHCLDIFQKEEKAKLHVKEIVKKLETEFNLIKSKDSVNSILRRKALDKKGIIDYGKGIYGLVEKSEKPSESIQ